MRTLKIASVLALCGAANLAHAADIPGVLGDPGTTAETNEQPTTVTVHRYTRFPLRLASEKGWGTSVVVKIDHLERRQVTEEQQCVAFTSSYNPQTFDPERAERGPFDTFLKDSIAELTIRYIRKDPDRAGVHIWSLEPLKPNATSQIDIGNRTFQLTNADDHTAYPTMRKNRIALIDAIMRGRTATFSSHGQEAFIQRTFTLIGATAMAEFAAQFCRAESANPGAPKPTPTARRKKPSQPTQQSRSTTTQPHINNDPPDTRNTFVEDVAEGMSDAITQETINIITNELFGEFGF